ncbi:hypothetical protein DFQ26_007871 [Actinomortierella ambigua]|nr:hypothetical protein DFQ26_007871 [Actinomortierella ambigua]
MTQLTATNSAHPFDVTEVLERILCMLDHDDLANARLVSRFWTQAAHRAFWQYPDLRGRGHRAIEQRLERYGSDVLSLDFTRSNLYSPDPLVAVDTITRCCPSVQELALPFGAFAFMGARRLINHYSRQLKVLRLDLSNTPQQPFMDLLTCLKALECLELKTKMSNLHASFLNYDELFKGCPRLWELIVSPAPYFNPDPAEIGTAPPPLTFHQEILGHPLVQQHNMSNHHHHALLSGRNTTTASLEAFTSNDLSRLKRLWLSLVWFSADHIRSLARACPNLIDLRLSYRASIDFDVPMPAIPFTTYLECWPNLKSLWIDGTRVSLPRPPPRQPQQQGRVPPPPPPPPPLASQHTASQTGLRLPSEAMGNLHMVTTTVPSLPLRLTTLSLSRANALTDEGLMQIVDSLCTILSRLNVDRCLELTDKGIRYVLMNSPALIRLSAAELNLTMNLFEDGDEDEGGEDEEQVRGQNDSAGGVLDMAWRDRYREHYSGTGLSPNKHPIRGWTYQDRLPRRTWACTSSLKTLDLSWRESDGRPPHIQIRHGIKAYLDLHETDVQPVAFPVHSPPLSSSSSSSPSTTALSPPSSSSFPSPPLTSPSPTPSVHGSARDAHGLPYTYEFCTLAELERWQNYDPRRVEGWMGYYHPLFRKKFRLASMYHRLRQLVNLEALLLRGWIIPWRAADLVAFTPPPASPPSPTHEPLSADRYQAHVSYRKWCGRYPIQALDGISLPAQPRDDRLSQHLLQEGFIPNLRYLDITLENPKSSLDPHNEIPPALLSGHRSPAATTTTSTTVNNSTTASSPVSNTSDTSTRPTRPTPPPPPAMEPSEYAQYSVWAAWVATCPRLTTILVKAQWLDGKIHPPYHDDIHIQLVRAPEESVAQEKNADQYLQAQQVQQQRGGQQEEQEDAKNVPIRSAVCTLHEYPALTSQGWAVFMS